MEQKKIGSFLCNVRKEKGYTQKQLYVYASPPCAKGEIDIADFIEYVKVYQKYAKLNPYDLENMGKLFMQFCAVCNFYGQYYASMTKNRGIFLQQAILSSKLLVWLERHIDELTLALMELM